MSILAFPSRTPRSQWRNSRLFAQANNGSATIETLPSWFSFFTRFIVEVEAPVGTSVVLGSRLIPKALFESAAGRARLVAHLVKQTGELGFPYIPVGTPIAFNYIPGTTSVTPAWRTALWHLTGGSTWSYNSTLAEIRAALNATHSFVNEELAALAPDSGSYMNEGDVYESNHEYTYWGPNYERLLAIKKEIVLTLRIFWIAGDAVRW
ncbi:FAD-binding domain-containing protein [Mycena sanguinolenta]|uniref:FAD-binding domain-containing protein n=1 Tax=Mycena sanguinolenta TaxID=230812 RepID=A0A8H6YAC2_9AGAR|nr:FAD-binding domain-containing protein [Mycena sanguinolenta]